MRWIWPRRGGKVPLLTLLSFLQRWGRGQQLATMAAGKSGAAGWRGGPGCWPSSPPPPSPQRPGWRCVRGGGAHVHHERVRRSHGALARRCCVRRQLCFALTRLLDGDLTRLQPETQETGEEDVRPHLWTLNWTSNKETYCDGETHQLFSVGLISSC